MCIKIKKEREYTVSLEVDTISGRQSVDISKADIQKTVKQLIDTAFGLLEIADSDRDSDQYENAMNLLQEAIESIDESQIQKRCLMCKCTPEIKTKFCQHCAFPEHTKIDKPPIKPPLCKSKVAKSVKHNTIIGWVVVTVEA